MVRNGSQNAPGIRCGRTLARPTWMRAKLPEDLMLATESGRGRMS